MDRESINEVLREGGRLVAREAIVQHVFYPLDQLTGLLGPDLCRVPLLDQHYQSKVFFELVS